MKTKKIISILTALTLAAAMTGCAQNTAGSPMTSTGTESRKSEKADTDPAKKEAASGDTKGDEKAPVTNDSYSAAADAEAPKSEAGSIISDGKISATEGAAADGIISDSFRGSEKPEAAAEAPAEPKTITKTDELPEIAIVATPDDLYPDTDPSKIPQTSLPEAGQLTAGEWNDNDNWGFFMNLVYSDKIQFPSFGIDPRYRIKLSVKNEKGEPVANAKAELFDDGTHEKLWTATTDKNGYAYLFVDGTTRNVSATVTSGSESTIIETFTMNKQNTEGQHMTETTTNNMSFDVTLNSEPVTYKATDIMFIMDATGSMADEMMFLQSEFSAIAKAAGTQDTRYSVNFYRDEGDEYVTKCNDFTDDIAKLQKTLNAQRADGGGDEPEAVAQILDESINKASWRGDSVKIAFLIFDAPPHHNDLEKTLQSSVAAAAEKGIRLIPVVSSNGSRDTELFARAIAIETGGTYVFLTDDSGIGDSHLEPIIGEYEVEKLYDIILRVIENYRQ